LALAGDHDQAVAHHGLGLEVDERRPQPHVGEAFRQQDRHLGGGGDPQGGLHRAVARREGVEQRARHVLGHGAGGDHPQQLRRPLRPADRVLGLDGQVHHLRRDGDQALAAGRQVHAAGRALDQGVAEVLAQRRQRAGHRGLADAKHARRRLHRPEPGHEHEGLELRQRHGCAP
jgi:hypothetical protein